MSWSPRTPGSWVRIFTAVIVGVGLGLTAVPPFTTGAVAAGSFVSDDFFGGFEAGRWTVVDPSGDGKVAVVGAGTGDARLSIGVPAGSSHDAWRSNGSVRVLQAMGDTGFGVEAKFDSVPSGRYADQGLQVVGADGRWLRFGVYSDGSALRAFAATTTGTSSTTKISKVVAASGQMWLRVTRSGTTYSFGYSADGQSWATVGSFADGLAVTAVGPYAGNAGGSSAPAHTALVDYVFDTSAPVVPEDGGLSGGGGGGGGGADTTAPVVSGVAVQRADTSAKVTWSTDEQSTGRVEYGTTQSYGQLVRSGTSGTTHAVTLTGLTPSTTYHYRVVATDAAGNTATTVDATFTTGAVAAGSFVSDDFFGGFEAGRWTVVDPSGDGKVAVVGAGTGDARLSIGVPAGSSHDAWRSNGSVRVLQAMGDTGFGVEAKFDSVPSGRYADQGLQVVGADGRWLRFGVYSDGSGLRAFAATTTGTSSTTKINKAVTASGQMWLRVTRSGTTYTFGYSADGQSWAKMGSFADGLAVTSVGPYAGNAGGSGAPAHTALVDYVFDTSAPVVPEDGGLSGGGGGGGGGADTTAPVVSGVAVQRADTSAKVTWSTNEQTTGRVEYGTTQSYGQLVRSGTSGTTHAVTLTGLTPSTTYHYRVVATDAAGNTATTVDATFTTSAVAAGPRIDLWHEGVLTVGAHGVTQPWVNVLGNMGDPAGITSASYRLNGGAPRSLSIGPDDRRLQDPGDFNADIAVSDLRLGDNTVTITATDGGGEQASITTTVRLVRVATPTIPYDQSWADGAPVQDQATVVDGRWRIQNGRLITSQLGYDRMVALGDASWRDYVVEAPVTVHKIGPDAGGSPSGPALVGLALRWQGHTATNAAQPAWGFYPVGAYAWTRFFAGQPRVQIEADNGNVRQSVDTAPFQFGSDYRMKALVQTVSSSSTRYAFKMWLASAPEPSSWQVDVVARGPATGSIALIAHHVDASFGRVSVTPVPAA